MAAVTGGAQILISSHLRVLLVGGRLTVRVAVNALEGRIIRRIDMAISTQRPFPGVCPGVNREILRVMIPGRRRPIGGRVARYTGRREIGGRMYWIVRCIVISRMAGVTIGRCSAVIPVGVA